MFKAVNVGFKIASSLALLLRDSTYDQLVAAVNNSVLPAGANLIQISEGCVSLKVQVVNLSALETLWRLYQDGTLEASLQALFVTDEMRELAGGEQVETIVTIEPQEYEKVRNELAAFEARGKGCFYFNSLTRSLRKSVLDKIIISRITVIDLEPEKSEKERRMKRWRGWLDAAFSSRRQIHPCCLTVKGRGLQFDTFICNGPTSAVFQVLNRLGRENHIFESIV